MDVSEAIPDFMFQVVSCLWHRSGRLLARVQVVRFARNGIEFYEQRFNDFCLNAIATDIHLLHR